MKIAMFDGGDGGSCPSTRLATPAAIVPMRPAVKRSREFSAFISTTTPSWLCGIRHDVRVEVERLALMVDDRDVVEGADKPAHAVRRVLLRRRHGRSVEFVDPA